MEWNGMEWNGMEWNGMNGIMVASFLVPKSLASVLLFLSQGEQT
jgi:hypothetical protein